jgi:hypothetical protein
MAENILEDLKEFQNIMISFHAAPILMYQSMGDSEYPRARGHSPRFFFGVSPFLKISAVADSGLISNRWQNFPKTVKSCLALPINFSTPPHRNSC